MGVKQFNWGKNDIVNIFTFVTSRKEIFEMSNSDYWDQRAKKIGHTGWADKMIYSYDQLARVKALTSVISGLQSGKELALDFGTGSGDFLKPLSDVYSKVIAFDISQEVIKIARTKHKDLKNIEYIQADSISEIELPVNQFDTILSITVLGHLLNDGELNKTLDRFYNLLNKNGLVIAMEYMSNNSRPASQYQRFLTSEEWEQSFSESGFKLVKTFGFYHPSESPCESFNQYKRNFLFKSLRKFQSYIPTGKIFRYYAIKNLKGCLDFFWEGKSDDSIKIMIFKKSEIKNRN